MRRACAVHTHTHEFAIFSDNRHTSAQGAQDTHPQTASTDRATRHVMPFRCPSTSAQSAASYLHSTKTGLHTGTGQFCEHQRKKRRLYTFYLHSTGQSNGAIFNYEQIQANIILKFSISLARYCKYLFCLINESLNASINKM